MAALFDLLLVPVPLIAIPLVVCDLAAGSAGVYAFCAGRAWAWLPLMVLNILKMVLYAYFAFLSLFVLDVLYNGYSLANSEEGKQVFLVLAVATAVGHILVECLLAWFARLAYRAFLWQRKDGLRSYQSCAKVEDDV